jgi:tRNA1Val (adenine37-N6)-methyltransferase
MPAPSPEKTAQDDYLQPEKGYRFSADSIKLAAFLPLDLEGRAADLGAGCGVVALEALARGRLRGLSHIFLVERQESFRPYLEHNIRKAQESSGPGGPAFTALYRDWRHLRPDSLGGPLEAIFSNPPYFQAGQSRPSPSTERLEARQELFGDIASLMAASALLLRPGGRLFLSFPGRRMGSLLTAASQTSFRLRRMSLIGKDGLLILAELRLGGPEIYDRPRP